MPRYTVQQGDCIMSIAANSGFLWETVWRHPDNAELKQLRKDPNVLLPGDVVAIPEKNLRMENAATDARHTYVKKNNRAQVRLRLLDLKRQPRKNVRYTANIDGVVSSGRSDDDGYIALLVAPNAQQLNLKVSDGSRTDEYALPLGYIDPIEELSGVQQRLTNLGYSCSSEQGTSGELTKNAIRAFQKERNLKASGDLDDATRQALQEMHGS